MKPFSLSLPPLSRLLSVLTFLPLSMPQTHTLLSVCP
jgi:hypothetical protein